MCIRDRLRSCRRAETETTIELLVRVSLHDRSVLRPVGGVRTSRDKLSLVPVTEHLPCQQRSDGGGLSWIVAFVCLGDGDSGCPTDNVAGWLRPSPISLSLSLSLSLCVCVCVFCSRFDVAASLYALPSPPYTIYNACARARERERERESRRTRSTRRRGRQRAPPTDTHSSTTIGQSIADTRAATEHSTA